MTETQAKIEIRQIAKEGARAVLKELGLSDDNAGADVKSLREMLCDWRNLKKNTLIAVSRWLTFIFLGALSLKLGFAQYLSIGKTGQ